jgi:hypothetical protein
MTKKNRVALAIFAFLVSCSAVFAQDKAQPQKAPVKASVKAPASSSAKASKEQNLKEYVKLLREDVRSEKYSIVDAVMQLDLDQAAKFWPIYRDYDAELSKVNDLRVANIEEYAQTYNHLTDEKADELVRNSMEFQKQRDELLSKYYLRVKQEMGAITAARFMQVERQLLLIIDLQISSSLPIAGS